MDHGMGWGWGIKIPTPKTPDAMLARSWDGTLFRIPAATRTSCWGNLTYQSLSRRTVVAHRTDGVNSTDGMADFVTSVSPRIRLSGISTRPRPTAKGHDHTLFWDLGARLLRAASAVLRLVQTSRGEQASASSELGLAKATLRLLRRCSPHLISNSAQRHAVWGDTQDKTGRAQRGKYESGTWRRTFLEDLHESRR